MYCDADRYMNDLERKLEKMPKCSCCREHIQDEYCLETPDGELYCMDCASENAADLFMTWFFDEFKVETTKILGD